MAEDTKQSFLDMGLLKINPKVRQDRDHHYWTATVEDGDGVKESSSSSVASSLEEDSMNISAASCSSSSSSSIELVEDASSSSSTDDGPLYELSELMAQLPVKRGLSKFYKGKSQSYTSLASVKSIEDLAKKVNPHNIRSYKMKPCKRYTVFDAHKSLSPKAAISKKASRGSPSLGSLKRFSNGQLLGLP